MASFTQIPGFRVYEHFSNGPAQLLMGRMGASTFRLWRARFLPSRLGQHCEAQERLCHYRCSERITYKQGQPANGCPINGLPDRFKSSEFRHGIASSDSAGVNVVGIASTGNIDCIDITPEHGALNSHYIESFNRSIFGVQSVEVAIGFD